VSQIFPSTNSWPTMLGHEGFATDLWRTLYALT
jgi:hypothetical protein